MTTFECAVCATRGDRSYQEDAAAFWPGPSTFKMDFALPAPPDGVTTAILADGMGGHAGGAIASQTACETFLAGISGLIDLSPYTQPHTEPTMPLSADWSDETVKTQPPEQPLGPPPTSGLLAALFAANAAIAAQADSNPALAGMGTTLVGVTLKSPRPSPPPLPSANGDGQADGNSGDKGGAADGSNADGNATGAKQAEKPSNVAPAYATLEWVSVGDSPLYLYRAGEIALLNEDHSLAPALDQLAAEGTISVEAAKNDPRRHMLRSAVTGDDLDMIDVSRKPLALQPGDVIVLASDGIHTLNETEIARIVTAYSDDGCSGIATALLRSIENQRMPHQDNATILVIRQAT